MVLYNRALSKSVKKIQIRGKYVYQNKTLPTTYLKLHTEENDQELDQRAIGVWKYVHTGINAYLKNQVKNYSKIDNTVK